MVKISASDSLPIVQEHDEPLEKIEHANKMYHSIV